jgi:large subunit ribosomal protein L35
MAKLKTKKALAKRVKITETGKIKRRRAGKGHILTKKNRKRKRTLRTADLISKSDKEIVRRLLPYG